MYTYSHFYRIVNGFQTQLFIFYRLRQHKRALITRFEELESFNAYDDNLFYRE